MAKLPMDIECPTLKAVDAIYTEIQNQELARPYLGMSGVGDDCPRKLWYTFRWCLPNTFDTISHKRFEDGHRTEALIVQRLKLCDSLVVDDVDPKTGEQFEFVDHFGHFKGHGDGRISGIFQAPKTPHVLEVKCVNEDKLKKLVDLKESVGEKNALREWDYTYYVQHILYMHYEGMSRGFLVCASPGGRAWTSCRTNSNTSVALGTIAKAKVIIFSPDPPQQAFKQGFYKCKWCSFSDMCWSGSLPERNCRTCMFASPLENDGQWICEKFSTVIPVDEQRKTHKCHRYIPQLVYAEQVDYIEDKQSGNDSVVYQYPQSGNFWTDSGPTDDPVL